MTGLDEPSRIELGKSKITGKRLERLLRDNPEFQRRLLEMIKEYRAGRLDIEKIKLEIRRALNEPSTNI